MLISFKNIILDREVDLPLSKSESNRALMILHYAKSQFTIDNEQLTVSSDSLILHLSNSDDTILLHQLLNKINEQNLLSADYSPLSIKLDCGNAGTVFRFLLTAAANLQLTVKNEQLSVDCKKYSQIFKFPDSKSLRFLLTGSERMKSRPIDSLVDALRKLGVTIEYQEKEGYPPVLFRNCHIDGGSVEVSVEQSSQFASSLLLAAPTWKNGLELHLTGDLSSLPYIDMTINMMRQCGIDVERNDRDIVVKPGTYNIDNIKIEPDWSAAAFWYEMVALSDNANVLLKNLNIKSLQADAAAIKMFETLGVKTTSSEKGIIIETSYNSYKSFVQDPISFDFKECPDLFPAVVATCAGLQIDAIFTGLKNLSIKESDRRQAMINELKKINFSFDENSDDELKIYCPEKLPCFTEENPLIFNNYGDHRIAMALSILSLKIGVIDMDNPEVVSKSYPLFYKALGVNLTSNS